MDILPTDLMNIVLEYSHHKKNKYDEGVEEINICIRIFKISWNYPREGYTPSIPRHYKVYYKKPSHFNCSRCDLFRDWDCSKSFFESHFLYLKN